MMTARNALATLATLAVLALAAGCSTTPNAEMAQAQARADQARAQADQAFYESLKILADGAGDGPRTAGIMAAFMRQQSLAQSRPMLSRSPDLLDRGFQLLDFALRGYAIERNASVAMRQSDNHRDVQMGMFDAMHGLAEQIQAPQANVTQTLTGPGVIGDGQYSAPTTTTTTTETTTTTHTDRHDVTGSYNPVNTTTYPQSP